MFNKLVKGFVVGVALIGSLTMVGCEGTESTLEENDKVEIENKYYNDNPHSLDNNEEIEEENNEVVDEDDMKGFIEEYPETVTDKNEGREYDPYTQALIEEELNKEHIDCSVCGNRESVHEKAYGMVLYDVCGYCYAVYKNNLFTGRYACNGCNEIVEESVEPIDGKGTALVCDECYNQYHNLETNENLDENGNLINTLE